jgi:hypothetical protein
MRRYLLPLQVVLAATVMMLPRAAHAVCTWEFQGIHSGWRCPAGEDVWENYSDLFKIIRDSATGPCAQAIGTYFEKDFACLSYIAAVVETHGAALAVVDLGAGACRALGGSAIQDINNKCQSENIRFRNMGTGKRSVIARACNDAGEHLWVAIGYYHHRGLKGWYSRGWYALSPGECRDLMETRDPIYVYAENNDGSKRWIPPEFHQGQFCLGGGPAGRSPFMLDLDMCDDPSFGFSTYTASFGEIQDPDGDGVAVFRPVRAP